jgi:hypothetical protein
MSSVLGTAAVGFIGNEDMGYDGSSLPNYVM